MNKLILPLTCLALLFTNIGRSDDLPFFSSLRAEIVNQLTLASNAVPLNKKLVSSLASSLMVIDRNLPPVTPQPSLAGGSAALATLGKTLNKTSLSNTFRPILIDTRGAYIDAMEVEIESLLVRLADTIPGKARASAQAALDTLSAALDDIGANADVVLSLKALSKAAKSLAKAEQAVVKAETAPPGANFVSARITETNQGESLFMPTSRTILGAFYDSFSEEVYIDAGDLKKLDGGLVQVRVLSLIANVSQSGTYTLSLTNDTQGYAIYERAVAPLSEFNSEEPEFDFYEFYPTIDPINQRLGTGTLTITVDLEANVVWGSFTFTARGSQNPNSNLQVSMTGSFLVRLETDDEFE